MCSKHKREVSSDLAVRWVGGGGDDCRSGECERLKHAVKSQGYLHWLRLGGNSVERWKF